MYIGLHTKYSFRLSVLNEIWIFLYRFSKYPQILNVVKVCGVGAQVFHGDVLIDRHGEVNNLFSQFYERQVRKRWVQKFSIFQTFFRFILILFT